MLRVAAFLFLMTICLSALAQKKEVAQLKSLNANWLVAFISHDTTALSRFLANDFSMVLPTGKRNRQQILTSIAKRSVDKSLSVRFTSVDARVVSPTMGLVNARVTWTGNRAGKRATWKSSYQDVYVKRSGRWQEVASHVAWIEPN